MAQYGYNLYSLVFMNGPRFMGRISGWFRSEEAAVAAAASVAPQGWNGRTLQVSLAV